MHQFDITFILLLSTPTVRDTDYKFFFTIIQKNSGSSDKEMFEVFNMGCRMEIYCNGADADSMINAAKKFSIDAQVIGRVEAAEKKELLIRSNGKELPYQNPGFLKL